MEVLGVLLRLVLAQHTVIVALATRVELLERGSSLHIAVAREARFGPDFSLDVLVVLVVGSAG